MGAREMDWEREAKGENNICEAKGDVDIFMERFHYFFEEPAMTGRKEVGEREVELRKERTKLPEQLPCSRG